MSIHDAFRRLAEAHGAEPDDDVVEFDTAGWTVRVIYIPGRNLHNVNLEIERQAKDDDDEPELPLLQLSKEGGGDRLAQSIHLVRELQIGDPEFDHQVLIQSDLEDEHLRALLSEPGIRQDVLWLLDHFRVLTFHGPEGEAPTRVTADGRFNHGGMLEPAVFDSCVERLLAMASDDAVALEGARVLDTRGLAGAVMLVVTTGVLLTSCPSALIAQYLWTPVDLDALTSTCMWAGVIASIPILLLMAVLVRGTSWSWRLLLYPLIVLPLSMPACLSAWTMGLNAMLDDSSGRRVRARVVEVVTEGDDKEDCALVAEARWRKGARIRLEPNSTICKKATAKGWVELKVREGWLGWQWFDSATWLGRVARAQADHGTRVGRSNGR